MLEAMRLSLVINYWNAPAHHGIGIDLFSLVNIVAFCLGVRSFAQQFCCCSSDPFAINGGVAASHGR